MKMFMGALAFAVLAACGPREEVIMEEPVLEEVTPAPVVTEPVTPVTPPAPMTTDSVVIDSAAPPTTTP
jgi:hypothetical protein